MDSIAKHIMMDVPHTPAMTPEASVSLGTVTSRSEMDDRRKRGSGETYAGGSEKAKGRRRIPELEDFELIRVLGKGCAGRVSPIANPASALTLMLL
jgi:hypothetical protein